MIGIRQAVIMRAMRDYPDAAYAGGLSDIVYEQTNKKTIISPDTICQVLKALLIRGLIEKADAPIDEKLNRRGQRGAPRKYYKLTESGHAEIAIADKIAAML